MKKSIFKIIFLFSLSIVVLPACNNPNNKDVDQHEKVEGHSDPANTGGAMSGDHREAKDTLNKKE